jgi:hypothetical protein
LPVFPLVPSATSAGAICSTRQLITFPQRGRGIFIEANEAGRLFVLWFMRSTSRANLKR